MSGLDGLASVQLSHAKSERLSEALIRGKDGQSCRFPFSHLMWSRPVGECQDSLAVFPKLPAEEIDFGRLKAWTAGGRMGTSVGDTATFSLFIAGCLKVEPHEIHDLFSLSLYIYLSVYSPVMFLVSD